MKVNKTENKEVYVKLEKNDYIIITNDTQKISVVVNNIGGKLHIDSYKWKKPKKKKEK